MPDYHGGPYYYGGRMNLQIGLQLITLICTAVLGAFIFLKNPSGKINTSVFISCLLLSGWNICGIIMTRQISFGIDPILTSRISMIFISLLYLSFLHFCRLFPYQLEESGDDRNILAFFHVLAVVSVILALKGLYIRRFLIIDNVGQREFTPLIYYFLGYSIISVGYGLSILLQKYLRTKVDLHKNQLKYVFSGLAVGFFVALFFSLILPITGNNKLFFIGETGSSFFVAFSAYAIIKHRLLDIEIVIRKSIVYSALVAAVIGIYVVLAIIFGEYLNSATGYGSVLATLFSALIIIAGYKPLETFVENTTGKLFFKDKYDYQKILKNLCREISAITDIDLLLIYIIGKITETMKVAKVSIWLKEEKEKWQEINDSPMTRTVMSEQVKINEALLKCLVQTKEIILLEEIEHQINYQKISVKDKKQLILIKNILKDRQFAIIVPIINKGDLVGTLNLGGKLSGDIYTVQDLEFLSILANHISIALENAKLNSEAKKMKEQLERAEKLAVLGKFASSLAHEIKNPLTSIKAFFHFLKNGEDEIDRQEIAELASTEIVRMESLLDNLLGFGRRRPPDLVPTNIKQVVDETLAITAVECKGRNVSVVKKYDELPEICADKKQLKQVFMNLIFNSLHAMLGSGSLTIEALHFAEEGVIRITFSDTGIGIEEEHLPRLFEPFFTTKEQGTGLGLNICKNIIAAHNGKITVESKKGKGTKVHILLPLNLQ